MMFSEGILLVFLFGILIMVRTFDTVTQRVMGGILVLLAIIAAMGGIVIR